jgi:hypothetical protein
MPGMLLRSEDARASSTQGFLLAIRTGIGRGEAEGRLFTTSLIRKFSERSTAQGLRARCKFLSRRTVHGKAELAANTAVLIDEETANCRQAQQKLT